jgi:hypothetical protein
MSALVDDIRNYSTDDGEEWWDMNVADLIRALATELDASPRCRLLVPATGEIFEAPLLQLVSQMALSVQSGHGFRIEAVLDALKETPR